MSGKLKNIQLKEEFENTILLITNIGNNKVSIFIGEQTDPESDLLPNTAGYVGIRSGGTIEVEESRVNYGQIDMLESRGILRVIRS
ncbi:hypothetical protein LCGC14_2448000 [marine sediment metagenome]|uniref:Uncharacterized protein n=1 Tax=marine sediment metagenome TaxID=412755 RepID=A0A0F9BH12_9ZZZZ